MTESKLTPFDDREVVKATIAVTNAGDGLSDALAVDPREFHHGETVFVVLETSVAKVNMVPEDSKALAGALIRQHTLKAGRATIISGDVVRDMLDEQQARIERHKGIMQLPLEDGPTPEPDEDDEVVPIGGGTR